MKKTVKTKIGKNVILTMGAILLIASTLIPVIVRYLEQIFSSDGALDNATKVVIGLFYLAMIFVIELIGIDILGYLDVKAKIKQYRLFLLSSTVGIVWITVYHLRYVLNINHLYFTEDSIFENITAINFFVSFLVLVFVAQKLSKKKISSQKLVIAMLLLIAFMSLFLCLEEISWGQRIFGWSTPELFTENVQHETNIHNYLPWKDFVTLYRIANILLAIIMTSSCWLTFRKKHTYLSGLILPPCDFIVLILIIMPTDHEIWEELVSILGVFYSMNIYFRVRSEITDS